MLIVRNTAKQRSIYLPVYQIIIRPFYCEIRSWIVQIQAINKSCNFATSCFFNQLTNSDILRPFARRNYLNESGKIIATNRRLSWFRKVIKPLAIEQFIKSILLLKNYRDEEFPKFATQDVVLTYAMCTRAFRLKNCLSSGVPKLCEIEKNPSPNKIKLFISV